MILNHAENIMLGSREVQKVYLGSQLIWKREPNFQLLDFIRTTNRQYFNTGYIPNDNTRIECEVLLMDNYDGFGQDLFGTSKFYLQYNNYGSHAVSVSFGVRTVSGSKSLPYFRKIRIVLDNQALAWYGEDGTLIDSISIPAGSFQTNAFPLWVGCRNQSGNIYNFGEFCLYSFKIYENNSLMMNFVPTKRISDGVSGMLDTLTEQFYPDENGGVFLSSVFEDNYQTVNAVQARGSLYINTGFVHTVNTKIVIDSIPIMPDSAVTNTDSILFGSMYNAAFGNDSWAFWCRTTRPGNIPVFHRGADGSIFYDLSAMDLRQRSVITAEGLDFTAAYPDGTSVTAHHSSGTITNGVNTMYLFNRNNLPKSPDNANNMITFYSCQIYDNHALVRDFIPVKQLSDNMLMLYDNVLKIPFLPKGGNFQS